ncbi:MAG TPA: FAD-dependent oxidoreductase [Thermoleophilaceae bacterium]|jgi:oxygen-dependent protoporphyrinogen oxidase
MSAERTEVVVVGAGLAGLTAALDLRAGGHEVVVLERGDRAGGRVRTAELDGLAVDLGAHFVSPRYRTVLRLIERAGLESALRPIGPSLCTAVFVGGRFHYLDFGRPLEVARYSALSPAQRARLGLMALPLLRSAPSARFFDMASVAAVDRVAPRRLLGTDAVERVFAPLSQALCGYSIDQVSLPLLTLGARFPLGRPLSLDGGLGTLGPALARDLPVRLGCEVTRVEREGERVLVHTGGDGFEADAVVLATTAPAALRAWPGAEGPARELLAATRYSRHFHAYFKTTGHHTRAAPDGRAVYMEVFPGGSARGPISHISFAATDPAAHAGLVFVAAHPDAVANIPDDEELAGALQEQLERLHPELAADVTGRATVRWEEKVPLFPRGRARELARMRDGIDGPVQLAGDYLYGPLIEAAALSGAAAARRVGARLAARRASAQLATGRAGAQPATGGARVAGGARDDHAALAETLRWAWSRPTLDEALAATRPLLHPDAVLSQPLVRTGRGFRSFERNMHGLARIFGDLRLRVVGWESAGDAVWVSFEITGTVGRRRLRVKARDRLVLSGGLVSERHVTMSRWGLVRPILATPSAWPRAVAVFLRSWV